MARARHKKPSGDADRARKAAVDASGRPVAVLRGHTDQAWGLAFTPDGHALATASWDGSVRLWGVSVEALARARSAAR